LIFTTLALLYTPAAAPSRPLAHFKSTTRILKHYFYTSGLGLNGGGVPGRNGGGVPGPNGGGVPGPNGSGAPGPNGGSDPGKKGPRHRNDSEFDISDGDYDELELDLDLFDLPKEEPILPRAEKIVLQLSQNAGIMSSQKRSPTIDCLDQQIQSKKARNHSGSPSIQPFSFENCNVTISINNNGQ
jgi:hypothetical protein